MFQGTEGKVPVRKKEDSGNKKASAYRVNEQLADKYKLALFDEPLPLIVKKDVGGGKTELSCNPKTLEELSQIEEPLCVIAVAGCLRTGKSYLLSRLLQNRGISGKYFAVGHSEDAHTQGIWIMCRPHPTQEGRVIAFLDTEGIDDPEKVEIQEDTWIFLMATLLCNVLVYNIKGGLDATDVDKFRFLNVIHSNVAVARGAIEDDSFLDFFFPNLVLVLRDKTLSADTSTEVYLEKRLMYKKGKSEKLKHYNEPRRLIRRYFKKRACFDIPIPCTEPETLESMPDSEIEQRFLQRVDDLRQYLCECSPKKLKSGKPVNGRMLRTMIVSYMNSVKKNTAPCLSDAMKQMAEEENQFAVRKASECYLEEMKQRLNKHLPNERGLEGYHKDCMDVAVKKLRELVVIDDADIFHRKAAACFENHLKTLKSFVERDCLEECRKSINILDMQIQRKIKEKKYAHAHGYSEYVDDINNVANEFTKQECLLGPNEGARCQLHRLSCELVPILKKYADVAVCDESVIRKALESIDKFEMDGLMNIGSEYQGMLDMKLQEIEKAKAELSEDDEYYQQMVAEYNIGSEIYEDVLAKPRPTLKPKPVLIDKPADGKRLESKMDGLMNIGSENQDILDMKLQEIEKARAELSEDDQYYQQMVAEYNIDNEIYEDVIAKPRPTLKPKPVLNDKPADGKRPESEKKKTQEETKCPIL